MRSILLHVDDDRHLDSRLQAAFDCARAFDGHLSCVNATPFDQYIVADPLWSANLTAEVSNVVRTRQAALRERVEKQLAIEGIAWDWIDADAFASGSLIVGSALADLVIVSRLVDQQHPDDPRAIASRVVVRAHAPVLAVPPGLARWDITGPVVVAWDGSPEVAGAMRHALPLLRQARSVHLVNVDDRVEAYPNDDAARYLSRHGVTAEIVTRGRQGSVAESLMAAALEFSAGTIVMGGYGHSRLREYLLGGTTLKMLRECETPLLLGH